MASLKKVKVVLLASEWSSKHGGISTFNRMLAIQLAQNPKLAVSVFLPECDQAEKDEAKNNDITLVQAKPRPGINDKKQWLCHPPKDLEIDFVIGHGVVLGCQAQFLKDIRSCKWVQFVHTDPEELGMFKDYADAVSIGEEKHQTEVKLCEMADFVVAVGPKLAEVYRSYLRHCGKDVLELTPGIFSEFSNVLQSTQEGGKFRVLSFGRGDAEDFHLKGFDIAAKAVANLNDVHLIFVGAASKEQDKVAARLKECNLPPSRLRVRAYMDEREGLKQLFCGVDLAIMPSRTEGFGLAALEALSAGLPVLVSANSGFGEALGKVPFGSGCVISSEDGEVWAEEIGKVMKKPRVTRLEESKSLLKNYAKKYNWQEQTKDLVEKIMAIREDTSSPSPPAGAKKRRRDSSSTGGSASKTSKSAPRSKAGGAKQSKAKPPNSANASMATLSSTGAKRKGGSAPKTSKSAPRSKAGGAKQSKASPSKNANGSMTTLSSTVAKRKGESLLTGGSAPKKSKPAPESKAGDDKQSKAKPRKSAASMKDIPVKDDDLEGLSLKLNGTDWEALARRLKFQDPEITAFDKENEEYPKKALKMLFQWKRRDGSKATYRVLHTALSHEFVKRGDLAEKFC